jgi:SH3 domain protein
MRLKLTFVKLLILFQAIISMQKTTLFTIIFLFIIFFTFSPLLSAKVKYVSDQLNINLRADKGIGFRIKKILPSGTKLKVITVDKSGYTQVKTEAGTTGWVLSRFLSKDPVARSLLKQAQLLANKLKEDKTLLNNELHKLKNEKTQLGDSQKKLLKRNIAFSTELEKLRKISARPLQLEKENEKLRNDLLTNESKNRLLQQELQSLKDDSEKQWFIIGAAILFAGILLGLILPKLRSNTQRKQNWNRL